jgi:hypothetical protein
MIEIGESWENAPQLYPARLTQLANTLSNARAQI